MRLVRAIAAVILLACEAQCAGEGAYWDSLSADDVMEEDLDHVWPNRYWEALHGHARCIPDYYGHCVPMELMNRICEFNRQADLGSWDGLGIHELRVHLDVEHGLRGENVSLTKISPNESAEGWNIIAQPTTEKDSMPCVRPSPPRLLRYCCLCHACLRASSPRFITYVVNLMFSSVVSLCCPSRDGAVMPCEMAAQWCRYAARSCAKVDKL